MTKKVFCQSCGMSLAQAVDFGTERNGQAATEYCRYCYQNGSWTQPNITLEETIALGTKPWNNWKYQELKNGSSRHFNRCK